VSAFMDSNRNMQEEFTAYIWLRYATQYIRDGQTHTLEMSVPVPVGATPELKAQLFREAEENMQQFTTQIEQHHPTIPPHVRNGQTMSQTAPRPLPRTKPTPNLQAITQRTSTAGSSLPANRPASQSAPPTTTLSAPSDTQHVPGEGNHVAERGTRPEQYGEQSGHERVERTHHNSGSVPGGENGGMPLPQFIQYIKDNLNLSPRQAMDILEVKSLTNGINLRDALEQLKAHSGQSGPLPTTIEPTRWHEDAGDGNKRPDQHSADTDVPETRMPTALLNNDGAASEPIELPLPRPAAAFDEEVGPDVPAALDDLEAFEDSQPPDEPFEDFSRPADEDLAGDQFSTQELTQAREKLDALRAIQGATTVTDGRLRVLNNVLGGQIDEAQLIDLISGVWNITVPKKLKVDQVEELISWAKREDAFIEQVEAILAVLND
jgi:hypothetical protein